MERVVVDTAGKIVIPPEVTRQFGFHSGDALAFLKTEEGVLMRQEEVLENVDAKTLAWWRSLSEEDKRFAREKACEYEALSEAERNAIWSGGGLPQLERESRGEPIMHRLLVEAGGQIVIPAEITQQLGLRPDDRVAVYRTPAGLVLQAISQEALAWAEEWMNSLTEEEKAEARKEAAWYESLSEAERDALWNQDAEELERWLDSGADEEDDEETEEHAVEISAGQRAA